MGISAVVLAIVLGALAGRLVGAWAGAVAALAALLSSSLAAMALDQRQRTLAQKKEERAILKEFGPPKPTGGGEGEE